MVQSLAVRFWGHVDKSDIGGCWLWIGTRSRGYGHFTLNETRSPERAHRTAWRLVHGNIPHGIFVLHRCDNPACVRPDHLYLGTQADNIRDAFRKGRIDTKRASVVSAVKQRVRMQCPNGHEYTSDNTYMDGNIRSCRVCRNERQRRYRRRARGPKEALE